MRVIEDLRTVLVHADFRKLFAVRLTSQLGDGLFQAGLATLFFFNPDNLATASMVAGAYAILLLPFTIVAPFAGPLLDRWRRRQVLLFGNAVRVVLTLALAAIMIVDGVGPAIYVLALVTLGVNRFLLAALSAGMPRVVPREQLLMANSLSPSLGGAAAAIGGGAGLALGTIVPDGAVLIAAALVFGAASALALRLHRDRLGPDAATATTTWAQVGSQIRATVGDLRDGARYLAARRTPGMALGVMAIHRFLYGVNFIALILMSRNILADPADAGAGLATFAVLAGISLAGNGTAILLSPVVHHRMAPSMWIVTCLGIGAVSQVLIGITPVYGIVVVSAFLLGFSVQGAKIAVDTVVHRDTDDAYRGRAFALYDMLYNAAFVGAAALAAAVLPDSGWAGGVFFSLAVVYLALAALYLRGTRIIGDEPAAGLPGTPAQSSGEPPATS